jgi:hypothetical protein
MASETFTEPELKHLNLPVLIRYFRLLTRWATEVIPKAKLVELGDIGHALYPAFFSPIISALTEFWREGRKF